MRLTRLMAGLALAAMVLAGLPQAAVASTPTRYVALGDSYASGVGAGPYEAGSGDCLRSRQAYPALWASRTRVDQFAFVACSGATADDLLASQLEAVNAKTTLVTVSIGGNDVGFAQTLTTCTLQGDAACLGVIRDAAEEAQKRLPAILDHVYGEIRTRASRAEVVVVGYPRLFTDAPCNALNERKRSALNGGADLLAGIVAAAAHRAGFTYLDARDAFAQHGVCSAAPWINGLSWPISDSYHPNRAGHADGYLPLLRAATA